MPQPSKPRKVRGWLLDVYPSDFGKVAVWVISENGERIKLTDNFQQCIYVSGEQTALEGLISRLCRNQKIASWNFVQKYVQPTDNQKSTVLEITLKDCRQTRDLALGILRMGDYLRYEIHNYDISADRAYLFSHDLFPLAYIQVQTGKTGLEYTLLDTVESLDYSIPKLRILKIELAIAKKSLIPNLDDEIAAIYLKQEAKEDLIIDYGDEATKLLQLSYAIKEIDPDIILTESGDARVFPYLIHRAKVNDTSQEFNLNRDTTPLDSKLEAGKTYFSYGHTFYRAGTARLYGRIHIDEHNTFIIREAGLDGFIEIARTCRVPLHTAARFSIGSSMSSIQFYQAMKDDILLPRSKKIPESFKSATELLIADRGGFIFEPKLGIYDSVGELDFSSMYPSLMKKYNISAETVLCKCCPTSPIRVPELNYNICTKRLGMVPKTVDLVLTKRLSYKHLKDQTNDERLKQIYDSRQAALKWILVTCFGYLGFSNAKFGSVDAHIAVCALARYTFLKAAHIAEDNGFKVLHGIVDSFWVKKQGATAEDFQKLCQIITNEIGIPINFEGHYKWIVFLPSRLHSQVSVLNRYFGAMHNGKVKVRGLEVRKSDTPAFIFNAQTDMIDVLSSANNTKEVNQKIPEVLKVARTYRQKLVEGKIPVSDLMVTKHLSKNIKDYKQQISQVIAAKQLVTEGVEIHAGDNITFLFTHSQSKHYHRRVVAQQLSSQNANCDVKRYLALLYLSAANLLNFAGYNEKTVCAAVNGQYIGTLSKYLN